MEIHLPARFRLISNSLILGEKQSSSSSDANQFWTKGFHFLRCGKIDEKKTMRQIKKKDGRQLSGKFNFTKIEFPANRIHFFRLITTEKQPWALFRTLRLLTMKISQRVSLCIDWLKTVLIDLFSFSLIVFEDALEKVMARRMVSVLEKRRRREGKGLIKDGAERSTDEAKAEKKLNGS